MPDRRAKPIRSAMGWSQPDRIAEELRNPIAREIWQRVEHEVTQHASTQGAPQDEA